MCVFCFSLVLVFGLLWLLEQICVSECCSVFRPVPSMLGMCGPWLGLRLCAVPSGWRRSHMGTTGYSAHADYGGVGTGWEFKQLSKLLQWDFLRL